MSTGINICDHLFRFANENAAKAILQDKDYRGVPHLISTDENGDTINPVTARPWGSQIIPGIKMITQERIVDPETEEETQSEEVLSGFWIWVPNDIECEDLKSGLNGGVILSRENRRSGRGQFIGRLVTGRGAGARLSQANMDTVVRVSPVFAGAYYDFIG